MAIKAIMTDVREILDTMDKDADKFMDKENDAAGARIRKAFLQISKKVSEGRKEVQEIRNTRKD